MTKEQFKTLARLWLEKIPEEKKRAAYDSINTQSSSEKQLLKEDENNKRRLAQTIDLLKNTLGITDWQFGILNAYYDTQVFRSSYHINDDATGVIIPANTTDRSLIITALEAIDYYLALESEYTENNRRWYIMMFEPVFAEDVTDTVREHKEIIHLTSERNLESILENGLLPKAKTSGLKNSPRIYFFLDDATYHEMREPIIGMIQNDDTHADERDFYMIHIDTTSLFRAFPNLKFYGDPRTEKGIYTDTTILLKNFRWYTSGPFDITNETLEMNESGANCSDTPADG